MLSQACVLPQSVEMQFVHKRHAIASVRLDWHYPHTTTPTIVMRTLYPSDALQPDARTKQLPKPPRDPPSLYARTSRAHHAPVSWMAMFMIQFRTPLDDAQQTTGW